MAQQRKKSDLNRDQQLERSSKARAQIIAYLGQEDRGAVKVETFVELLKELGLSKRDTDALLRRMADNNQITHVKNADRSIAYTRYTGAPAKAATKPKRKDPDKAKRGSVTAVEPPVKAFPGRPEITIEGNRVVVDHPNYKVVVEIKP